MLCFRKTTKQNHTFAAVTLEGIGQSAFQFIAIGSAFASFHQALEVVVQQAIGLQDFVQVDTIVFGGVLRVLSTDESEDHNKGND
jgi:hypothetical protein